MLPKDGVFWLHRLRSGGRRVEIIEDAATEVFDVLKGTALLLLFSFGADCPCGHCTLSHLVFCSIWHTVCQRILHQLCHVHTLSSLASYIPAVFHTHLY